MKVEIEDTGLGVTFAGDPGKYRVWRATDPNGIQFLITTRSAFYSEATTQPSPIDQYIEVTEEMLLGANNADELLAALRRSDWC